MDWNNKDAVRNYHQTYREITRDKRRESQRKYKNRNSELLKSKCKDYRNKKAFDEFISRNFN